VTLTKGHRLTFGFKPRQQLQRESTSSGECTVIVNRLLGGNQDPNAAVHVCDWTITLPRDLNKISHRDRQRY